MDADDEELRARMAEDESYCPPNPPKAAKWEMETNAESDPFFDTHKSDRSVRRMQDGGMGVPSTPLNPKKLAARPIDQVIDELAAMGEEIDELVAEKETEWPPRRSGNETMEEWRAPSVTGPLSKAEEEFRRHWRRDMCPSCRYHRGRSDLRKFHGMKKAKYATGTKHKSRPASASPHLSLDGAP